MQRQCSVERDRAFVEGCIRRWYGSDAAFERTVREDLVGNIHAAPLQVIKFAALQPLGLAAITVGAYVSE